MAKVEVLINGIAFPCRPTMGAMLRFKRETGREVTAIDGSSMEDLVTYLYCCVASACSADKVDFSMNLIDFADALSPEDLQAWTNKLQESNGNTKMTKSEKKR